MEPDKIAKKYVVSVISAFAAELVTYPLDLTKTRLQIQGEGVGGGGVPYRGMVSTARGIVREEGVLRLWQGVTPGLARHVVYSGLRMCLYDWGRDKFTDGQKQPTLGHRVVLGMWAGGLAQLAASPADLVKVRMQMEGRRRLEGLPGSRVSTMRETLISAVREGGGVRGLWKGAVPNVQRAALVNLGDLTTYDQVKTSLVTNHSWSPDSWVTHSVASGAAGLAAAAMGTPADVVKARMMNQPVDPVTRGGLYYKGSLDCLVKTVQIEGVVAMYKGFLPCWLRMAPWSLTFWVTMEQIRMAAGLQSW